MPVVGCKSNGYWCQNHLLTKLTTTCVGFGLLAHISASKNAAHIQPIFSEFIVHLIFFWELQSICWAGWTNNVASMRPIFLNYNPFSLSQNTWICWAGWTNNVASMRLIYFFLTNYSPFALSRNTWFCWAGSNYNVGLGVAILSKNNQGLSISY